ncbi:MAG: FtsX-like permease family protein [Atopobiaceae bacterium]|jgi:putative ABC transport system permease protein
MLLKLALGNVRRSARDYALYFVTLTLGVAVFYAFNTISDQAQFLSESASLMVQFIGRGITGVTVFLALIMGFLMVYANNYLVKRRKRELGLYQVLGMTRRQVSIILTLETLVASVGSLIVGFLVGMVLSQILVFVTAALFNEVVRNFTFKISEHAIVFTLICYALIFVVMLIFNLISISKVSLTELMGSERTNEQVKVRSLPATIILGAAGIVLMAWAYVRLTKDGLPVMSLDQYGAFLITTLMVSVGTLAFFYALSGILLRLGMSRKAHYLRGINMFTIRQLASRINTVSVSMGVVSLVLFLAITISSSGFGFQKVFTTNLEVAAPYDATISAMYVQDADGAQSVERQDLQQLLVAKNDQLRGVIKGSAQIDTYYAYLFEGQEALSMSALAKASNQPLPKSMQAMADEGIDPALYVMDASSFNAIQRLQGAEEIELNDNGYLFLVNNAEDNEKILQAALDHHVEIMLAGHALTPATSSVITGVRATYEDNIIPSNTGTIVVPDSVIADAKVNPSDSTLALNYAVSTQEGDKVVNQLAELESTSIVQTPKDGRLLLYQVFTKTAAVQGSAGVGAIAAYLAIYIGFVLVVACAAILGVQQISAASDAAANYRLLSEIGVPREMELKSLRRQVGFSFALPLVVALAHAACALVQVMNVIKLFSGSGIIVYTVVSVVVFVGIYLMYFAVTYVMARGIVTARTQMVRA